MMDDPKPRVIKDAWVLQSICRGQMSPLLARPLAGWFRTHRGQVEQNQQVMALIGW